MALSSAQKARLVLALVTLFAVFLTVKPCHAGWVCHFDRSCDSYGGRSTTPSSNPSTSNQLRINPSAVPIERGLGIEGIFYSNVDFALVKGFGRVGAAISPSNSESTFFGPPPIESPEDFYERSRHGKKYEKSKYTLATAFRLFGNKRTDLRRFEANLGVMAKYNSTSKAITPGAGLSAVVGPFTLGYSFYSDTTRVASSADPTTEADIYYNVQTYSAGIYLSSLILDYSHLVMKDPAPVEVDVISASLMIKKFIVTASTRDEKSDRPVYDFITDSLIPRNGITDFFGGVQYRFNDHFMAGGFYNFYLLDEISLSATLFF